MCHFTKINRLSFGQCIELESQLKIHSKLIYISKGRLAVLKKKREIIAMKKLSRLMQDQRFG